MINFFNFRQLGDKILITNDIGKFMFISKTELDGLIRDQIDYSSELGKRLVENYFCYDGSLLAFSDVLKSYYRDMKSYLLSSTALHIFALTNACNADCVYCQAHSDALCKTGMMSYENAKKAVDIALSVPDRYLSFEFQGGEPLLNFGVLKYIIEYSEGAAKDKNKIVNYNLVSNLTLLNDEMLEFLLKHNVSISTSIDGGCDLHDKNRPLKNGCSSYEELCKGIHILEDSNTRYGAIQTTTKMSLDCARSIIDEYIANGLDCVFIRSLTPLGCASANWERIGYTPDEFIRFYKECLDYIIELNQKGTYIKENFASILLTKIIKGYSLNYMELRSPCGAGIGQIAYNYDGKIYTCDEGRMLAEMGNTAFMMGTTDNSYEELINSAVCKAVCVSSIVEAIPGCSDCVYSPYCCKCPVVNYSMEHNVYTRDANDYKCRINRGILDLLFSYMTDMNIRTVFESWVR